jgi:hypothetical protein
MDKELSQEISEVVEEDKVISEKKEQELSIISDECLLGVYGEIMDNLRDDRSQVSGLVDTFSNMVLNDGDSSSASK